MTFAALILAGTVVASPADLAEWHHLPMSPGRSVRGRSWILEPGLNPTQPWTYGCAQDLFLIYNNNQLTAFATASGGKRWAIPNPMTGGYPSDIRNLGRNILCGSTESNATSMTAIDPKNGSVLWQRTFPFFTRDSHAVGSDLLIAAQVGRGPQNTPSFDHLEVVNGQSGKVKAVLSATDATVNRRALMVAAPTTVDQIFIFGETITRNGIVLPNPGPFENAWVVGDHLITHYTLDDFPMDLGTRAGFTALRSYRVSDLGKPEVLDLWKGRGEGRAYHQSACASFNGVLGEQNGRLLAFFHNQLAPPNKDLTGVVSLVSVPLEGDMVASPVFPPGAPKFSGGWRTPDGFLLWGDNNRTYAYEKGTLVEQPLPKVPARLESSCSCIAATPHGLLYRLDDPTPERHTRFYLQPYR